MTKRICPTCGEPCYSAAVQEEYWECPHCGAKIPRGSEVTCQNCKHSTDYGESVLYIICSFGKRKKYVKKSDTCQMSKEKDSYK